MKIYKLYNKTVKLIMCAILAWLAFLSIVSTSYITKEEHTFYLTDSPVFVIVIIFGIFLMLIQINKLSCIQKIKKDLEDEFKFRKVKFFMLLTILVTGMFWVLCTQFVPGADQHRVLDAAYGLHRKDYTMFMKGGYIEMYPNQIGLVVIYYLISFIIGDYNYIFLQLFNAVCVCFICKVLSEISEKFGLNKLGQLCVLGLGLIFFPLSIYSSFVYGTIPGLMFALYAIKLELQFYEEYNWRKVILSGLFITIALMFKSNYLIFFIGMVIFSIFETINKKRAILIGAVGVYFFGYFFQAYVPKFYLEQLTGYELDGGASSWSWIAMGLQDTSSFAPGWYNAYNADSYKELGYDSEIQKEEAKKIVAERVEYFLHNKEKAISFFTKKTASQWNNPTFQCFWIGQVRNTNIKITPLTASILQGLGSEYVIYYLNIVQSVILVGALLSISVKDKRTDNTGMTLFQMIFIGGFAFHMFWEGKSQYTLPYFVLLLPLAVSGYLKGQRTINLMLNVECQKSKISLGIAKEGFKIIVAIVCVGLLMMATKMCDLPDEKKEYQQYLSDNLAQDFLEDGEYRISSCKFPEAYLESEQDIKRNFKIGIGEKKNGLFQKISIVTYQAKTRFRFCENNQYMYVGNRINEEKAEINLQGTTTNSNQEFYLKKDEKGKIYIMYGNEEALTYEKGQGICLKKFIGDYSQKWNIEKWEE